MAFILKKSKNFFFLIICFILFTITKQKEVDINENDIKSNNPNGCSTGEIVCNSLGDICLPQYQCPTKMSCPKPYTGYNHYSCSVDDNYIVDSQCGVGLECWDNTCISNTTDKLSKCPTMTSCPPVKNHVRCPDNSCVEDESDCPNYFECPLFLPIHCPNGDCRQSLEDCPSLIICPKILPVLCNDGSCHSLNTKCEYSSEETQCSDTSMVRCPDGSCTSSKFLCPTPMTCPKGYQKCFNGFCRPKGECYNITENIETISSTCNDDNKILCNFDFSCRNDISSCPTGIICPVDKPVKCWDSSCKENINQCPEFQKCPNNMKECPDGSCTIDKCGTHITCSVDAPYRCFDNTCKKNPDDCPAIPSCPNDKPILCWDGRCLSNRGECQSPSICDNDAPVKCPDGLCYQSGDSCKSIEECPAEFDQCPDGTCMRSKKDCTEKECPLNFPHKCMNGMCVSKEEYCENENGCPWNKPIKCNYGECVAKDSDCKDNNAKCPESTRRCPDGSCLHNSIKCPAESGCPVDTPIRCADGTCIKKNDKESCPIPTCPSSQPYRCENGLCVTTISSCPSEYNHSEEDKQLVVCADSTLAHFFDECKPVFECIGTETVRCGDGSCRKDKSYCPLLNENEELNTCPNKTKRCDNGACANTNNQCLLSNGCFENSKNQYKCISNGACVKDEDECEELSSKFNLANGCQNEYPIKCVGTGKCVTTESECARYNGCKTGEIVCPDGKCAGNIKDCKSSHCEIITCLDPSDVICADDFTHCYNKENCEITSPFRSLTGECKKYPFSFEAFINETDSNDYTSIGIKCPEYKPYLCLDGSCVEKTSFCKSMEECPEDKQYRCFDRTCSDSQRLCETQHNKCPGLSPILCPNGNCVSDIIDCLDSACPYWLPYNCLNGKCEESPRECLYQYLQIDEVNESNDEISEEGIKIYGNTCEAKGEYICNDGTCRKNKDECPLYKGCTNLDKPYKCPDGSCAVSQDKCLYSNKTNIQYNYTNDSILCQDGIYRKECPEFNGCTNEKPLFCSNGHCVSSLAECAGISSCISSNNPFRCADGSCVQKLSDCRSALREFGSTNIILMTYPHLETNVPIVIGESNLLMASINVPSDTFLSEGVSVESRIFIQSYPKSKYNKTFSVYDRTRYDDVSLVYPYSDPNGNLRLEYEYTILSTVINITTENKTLYAENGEKKDVTWNNNLILSVLYDFPYKHEGIIEKKKENANSNDKKFSSMPLDALTDICLGKLEVSTGEWKCNGLSQEAKSYNNLQLKASINSSGIYAVILDPKQNSKKLNVEFNFFLKYLLPITIVLILVLLILGILCYVFSRIYRYRRKYKDTKEKVRSTNIEFNMLGVRQSQIQGETLADQEEGVIFTSNPCYRNANLDVSSNTRQLEDMRDKFTKKLKALEKNNKTLKEQTENLKDEIKRLKDYKQEMQNPEN